MSSTGIPINGRLLSQRIDESLFSVVSLIEKKHGVVPALAVILVGDNPASEVYVRNKHKKAVSLGIISQVCKLHRDISHSELQDVIHQLNHDRSIHGILIQMPLPKHLDGLQVLDIVSEEKDVDGFGIDNIARLASGRGGGLVPCTPHGCLHLIKSVQNDISGLHAVVVGRSNIVGKPMANLLLKANTTVTIAHSYTLNLKDLVMKADIVVAAVGIPGLIHGSFIKPGAIVIDVGINTITVNGVRKLTGDVDFETAMQVAKAVTPVPGGVGPMTVTFLMINTVIAACRQNNISLKYEDIIA